MTRKFLLNLDIRNSKGFMSFKSILKFIRSLENSVFLCNNTKGIELTNTLRFSLCYLREHEFQHSLQDTLNPI